MPDWVLVNPGDVGLALDTQYGAPLAFFSLPAVFLACRRGLGKRRNVPSDETVRDTPWERVPGAVQRVTLLRRTGSASERMWTPDQQRTTPQGGALRCIPGNAKESATTPPRSVVAPAADWRDRRPTAHIAPWRPAPISP